MVGIGAWLRIGAVVAVLAGLGWSHHSAYRAGAAAAQAEFLEQIRQENEHAGKAAEDWRARYRLCVERGGLYDFEAGTCDR